MTRIAYQTRQSAALRAYLETVQGVHMTVSDISASLRERGVSMGTSTVYRHLEKLVEEGLVAKYVVDGSTSACFEYLGQGGSSHREECFHCKCSVCGRLVHLHCREANRLEEHLLAEHGFALDPVRTVFFGVCAECRQIT